MEKERKIAKVVKRMTFADAEKADNIYWANASDAERLNTLYDLREMMAGTNGRIKKVIYKRGMKKIKLQPDMENVTFGEAWQNRKIVKVENVPVNFIGFDDLIKVKTNAGRPQDLVDVMKLKNRKLKQ